MQSESESSPFIKIHGLSLEDRSPEKENKNRERRVNEDLDDLVGLRLTPD